MYGVDTDEAVKPHKKFAIYSYQEPVIEKLLEFVEANAHKPAATGFVVMPGGSGKTFVFSEFASRVNGRVIILSPSLTIFDQNFDTMRLMYPGMKISVCTSTSRDLSGDVIYITYHLLVRLLKEEVIGRDFARFVISDEAHKSLSLERSKIPDLMNAICIGFTATDKYSEQKNVENVFKNEIYRMSLKEGIEMGILLPLRGFIVETHIDLRNVKLTPRGVLDDKLAEKHLNVLARNKAARDFYLEKFKGVPGVAFCLSVQHAIDFAKYLSASGVRSEAVHGRTSKEDRRRIFREYEQGKLDILCSRDVLIEGWNSERATIELNLRPTYSWILAEQRACRVVRTMEGKKCGIVVEFQDIYNKKD